MVACGEILGADVELAMIGSLAGHAAAGTAAFVEQLNGDAGFVEYTGGTDTGHAGADYGYAGR
jgi:hypothetical protein